MKYKIISVVNLIVTVLMIGWNYYINAVGINGLTISDLSNRYENLFTPASYAFSIWGVIFIGLMVLSIYYCYLAFTHKIRPLAHEPSSLYFLITANIFNGLWSYFFITQQTGISIVVMYGILISLIICIVKLRMELYDADTKTIVFIWWPICLYSGWITVAAIANVASHLSRTDFETILFSDYQYTVFMIIVAAIINILMVYYRNMREFGLIGVWSLTAIFARHFDTENNDIAIIALASAAIILTIIVIHGYKNRSTNIFKKIKE